MSDILYYAGHAQKNCAVSKDIKKFIPHPTRVQQTLSAAVNVQVSHAIQAIRSPCLLRGRGKSFQDGLAAREGCVLGFEVSRSVITVQREFRARFKKHIIIVWCVFFRPYTKLTLHCNHRSGHLKTEPTESLLLLRRHLGNWSRSKYEKGTAGSA
jgi:hypothetical protein